MGGKGSGRRPNPENIIKRNYQAIAATSEPIYIPNLSGVKHEIKEGTHNITTDDLAEGSTNLYYTDARAVTAVANDDSYLKNTGDTATGDFNFDSGTLFIDSTNNRVGIGTSSPDQKLSIEDGQLIFQHSSSNQFESGRIRFTEFPGTSYQGSFIHYDGSTNVFNIGVHSINDKTIDNDVNVISILRSNGNVGIGTTGPGTKLEVVGAIRVDGDSGVQFEDTSIYINRPGSGTRLAFNVGGERLSILDGGNVGIGTTSPSGLLHLSGGALLIQNTTEPATPTNAGALFVSGGALLYKGSSGTITTIANA